MGGSLLQTNKMMRDLSQYIQENIPEFSYNDGKIEIYTRVFKGTTFVNVLVNDEEGFDVTKFDYPSLRQRLIEFDLENTDKSVVFIAFQHNNEKTIEYCKKLPASTKNAFIQGAVFNPKSVHMDFYKPVPQFYKLYDHFCEDLYFDFAGFAPGIMIHNEEELISAVTDAFDGKKADRETIQHFCEYFLDALDGHSTERVVHMIEELLCD